MEKQRAHDRSPVEQGTGKIEWARSRLRLLARLEEEFRTTRPFAGLTIGICLHIEPKTAVLCGAFQAGGAEVVITGSPGTTQDDVADALRRAGALVFGSQKDDAAGHLENVGEVLRRRPHLILDNGADLAAGLVAASELNRVMAGTEETTTGANRLREELGSALSFPVIVINDSPLKLIMENEHGVGPTVVEGFMRATNLLVPSKRFVVFGYGSVGRGIAKCLRALGARVGVVEPDSIRALEAALDGMLVVGTDEALKHGEVFITATGRPGVIIGEHFGRLPDGAILANAGHFSWEIDLEELRRQADGRDHLSEYVEIFTMQDGRRIALLARGEMLNLAGGGGNPVETMDLGLALQAMSMLYLVRHHKELASGPQPVPAEINFQVARSMVDLLSRGQSWS
jgi:adenosylhomocysteinase